MLRDPEQPGSCAPPAAPSIGRHAPCSRAPSCCLVEC